MPTWIDGPYGEDKQYQTMMVLRGDKIAYAKKRIAVKRIPVTIRKNMIVDGKVLTR